MSSYTIEIPKQVIEVEVQYNPATVRRENNVWSAWIEVGGVRVMEREYNADWPAYEKQPDNFASDPDAATSAILAEFGEKLKKLLED